MLHAARRSCRLLRLRTRVTSGSQLRTDVGNPLPQEMLDLVPKIMSFALPSSLLPVCVFAYD